MKQSFTYGFDEIQKTLTQIHGLKNSSINSDEKAFDTIDYIINFLELENAIKVIYVNVTPNPMKIDFTVESLPNVNGTQFNKALLKLQEHLDNT